MLNQYLQMCQLLLKDPKEERFNIFDLQVFVNQARGQVAIESGCIQNYATMTVDDTSQQWPFTGIVLAPGTTGVAGVLNVEMITFQIAGGARRVTTREWPFFNDEVLNNPAPVATWPYIWAQYGRGVAGVLFFNVLDGQYNLNLDTTCYPLPLTSNSSPDAIPFPWTDAVPYYAAYLALLTAQQPEAADAMFKLYELFTERGTRFSTSSVLPEQFSHTPDPFSVNRLGVTMSRGTNA